ncbi:uncharacterized protein LOC122571618 isoform X5 [Bombus pyrosoma]|uniref:uncharacterized protein LOC122571618 isoform X5 n=1 Tax=Bombus pyrosoma TaxID=396416 RepID=UPI001CB99D24|nr:uncharacterized protein LOC122571618 isoform X5 [Bombus pyrosoma]
MSSSYIIEPQESGSGKKDDTLIIIVNDDGTISVDQETLQTLIMNQSNANVSVVRVGQAETDTENGDITLTVDPPMFTSAAINSGGTSTDATSLVDPFMEMDPEQLERLETALQSEEAKQILGENVTAMLDMLTVEEQQNSIRYSVKLDHCYTSRLSPSDPKPRDPLPVIDSPTSDDGLQYTHQHSPAPGTSKTSSPVGEAENTVVIKPKATTKTGKPVGRPRKNIPPTSVPTCNSNTRSSANIASTPKSVGHPVPRNLLQQGVGKHQGRSNDEDEEELMSSTESSESEPPSDNDSDFGPRGPRRGGIRARGGRKGLTTRGGSMVATRRRGPNKQMDMEQVRRLDMEMAAAVNAMKSPEKDEKSGGFGFVKGKRQLKTVIGRKKEESQRNESSSIINQDVSVNFEKPLQTTNQVKANLINANMVKGDMILTKPGQGRANQKVTFVQKQVLMKSNDLKNIDVKKQVILPKGKFFNQTGTKFFATKDGKLVQIPVTTKTITSNLSITQMKGVIPQVSSTQQPAMIQTQISNVQQQQSQQLAKVTTPAVISKIKSCDPKKEKRKSDGLESVTKIEIDTNKTAEIKVFDGMKKHAKKENRKSPAYMVDTLGPALFSTPDIIRRVGTNGDSKVQENVVTPSAAVVSSGNSLMQVTHSPSSSSTSTSPITSNRSGIIPMSSDRTTHPEASVSTEKRESHDCLVENHEAESKPGVKSNVSEELQPALDSGAIEGEEHLLATLEMEASKHEEELLAEALLLQEELGVDLAEHATLVEQGGSVASESITSNNMLIPSLVTSEQEGAKSLDASATIIVTTTMTSTATVATMATTSANTNELKETGKKFVKDDKEPIQIIRGGRVITLPPIEAPATRSKRLQIKSTEPIQKSFEPAKRMEKHGYSVQTMQQRASSQSIKHEIRANIDQGEKNECAIRVKEENIEEEAEEEEDEEEEDIKEKDRKHVGEEDEEEEEEEEEDNSDSEDDPDRLWCICKRPHNNRFMICCDVCEDWFHGKCVHVSKAMGQQMEEKGIEWVCPNCAKKKDEEIKAKLSTQNASGKQRIQSDTVFENTKNLPTVNQSPSTGETSPLIQSGCDYGGVQYSSSMQCVVCKKEARNSSIYCSDACILAHAQETLTKDKPIPGPTISPKGTRSSPFDPASKSKPDARVIVFERKSGRILTGSDAPTRSNLRTWLKEHPTFEVVGTNNLGALQIGKTITTIQTQIPGKTTKSALLSPAKGQNLPKMTYAKVPGSKQMILTAGNKKFTLISGGQQQQLQLQQQQLQQQQQQQQTQPTSTKSIQMKQTLLPGSNKSPLLLKTTKLITQPQIKQLGVAVSPKQTPNAKKQESKQAIIQSKQQQIKPSPPRKPETEPIRLNIRKTLTELLSSRIKETEDLKLTDEEIADLAYNIELELYKYFKDTGAKYKAKYRSLVFNIKDTKNLTLFRKIADRSLTPDAVVRLSPDEMASQELAEWREKETKHQLEMIKKNELDLMAQAKSIVVKTHKGEQIIENDGGIDHVDPKTPVQDIVTALNSADSISSTVDDMEKDLEKAIDEERLKGKEDAKKLRNLDDKKRKEKDKDRGREKERDKEKERGKEKESSNRSKGASDRRGRSISRSRHKHGRDDRERSKTREKSRERRSRDKEGKREREKDRDKEKERDRERDRERSRTRDREKLKLREKSSRDKAKQKEKDREKERERERHKSNENILRSRNSGFAYSELKNVDKREDEKKREMEKKEELSGLTGTSAGKSIEDRLWRHIEDEATTNIIDGNDSDVSDREPSSTVNIKTPDINEEVDREREQESSSTVEGETPKAGGWQTVWRGFVNMVDVAKFFITAQEVSGHAKDLMDDLPDTVDVVGRISHETVWDYISKMKKTGSKEILVIRLTAANDEEKIPYITLYSYLNSRSRLGVVGNVSKNIKDFYIMPFSSQSTIPQVLLPLNGPGFEEHRPHLLLGIIVRNKRKRPAGISSTNIPMKLSKKDTDRSYTPPLIGASKDKSSNGSNATIIVSTSVTSTATPTIPISSPSLTTATSTYHKTPATTVSTTESTKEKQHPVTQTTLDNLNRAHIGMSRSTLLDTATICKIVPELSSKIDLTSSPGKVPLEDDGDEPYSPGQMDEEDIDLDLRTCPTSTSVTTVAPISGSLGIHDVTALDNGIISSSKNSTELQRKMEELNRQIEEQKQQIQNISSSFLGESTSTLPGLGLDPPPSDECEEAYSPSDTRSFTPPPPTGIPKFTQPILEKVSNITIPPNLQEILANVKRQESSKVDPYLPSKPSATFLTTANSSIYQNSEKYSSSPGVKLAISGLNKSNSEKSIVESSSNHRESISKEKESKGTLSSLSDLDLIRKAEEELAAVAAASAAVVPGNRVTENSVPSSLSGTTTALPSIMGTTTSPSLISQSSANLSSLTSTDSPTHEGIPYKNPFPEPFKRNIAPEQPKPPGLEDEDFPPFPSTPPNLDNNVSKTTSSHSKFVPKSGIVLSVKRKVNDDVPPTSPSTSNKIIRIKSRWGQGPSESID